MTGAVRAMVAGLALVALLAGCATNNEGPYPGASKKASRVNSELGAKYLRAGELRRADEKLRKALRQDKRNPDAHTAYALLNMRLNKPDKARTHFERALDLEPDNPQIQNNFGTFLCEEGEHDRGIDLFLRAADNRLYDTPAYAYANAGRCARAAGRDEDARTYLRRALENDPRLPSALRGSAELAVDEGRFEQAADYVERYREVAGADPAILWLGVRVERGRGDREAAKEYGLELLRRFRDSDEAQRFLDTR